MRTTSLLSLLVCLLASFALAWEKEDHEIFRLRDDVLAHEGPNITFYAFIGVSPKASQEEINRAYRKKASRIHPDKAKASFVANYGKPKAGAGQHKKPSAREVNAFHKEASDRFSRLGVVANILRGSQRERYDYFLRNGFPAWRGTGYYYARYRPGLGMVLAGLFVVMGGFAHYGALYLGWKRQRDFVDRYIRHARRMAWGNDAGVSGIPGVNGNLGAPATSTGFESAAAPASSAADEQPQAMNWNRKERRAQEKEQRRAGKNPKAAKTAKEVGISEPENPEPIHATGPQGAKKRVMAENGKVLIVDSMGQVYLEEETEEGQTHEYLLDPNEIAQPTIYDTALFTLPKWAYRKSVGRFLSKPVDEILEEIQESEADGEMSADQDALKQATAINPAGEARKRRQRGRV